MKQDVVIVNLAPGSACFIPAGYWVWPTFWDAEGEQAWAHVWVQILFTKQWFAALPDPVKHVIHTANAAAYEGQTLSMWTDRRDCVTEFEGLLTAQ